MSGRNGNYLQRLLTSESSSGASAQSSSNNGSGGRRANGRNQQSQHRSRSRSPVPVVCFPNSHQSLNQNRRSDGSFGSPALCMAGGGSGSGDVSAANYLQRWLTSTSSQSQNQRSKGPRGGSSGNGGVSSANYQQGWLGSTSNQLQSQRSGNVGVSDIVRSGSGGISTVNYQQHWLSSTSSKFEKQRSSSGGGAGVSAGGSRNGGVPASNYLQRWLNSSSIQSENQHSASSNIGGAGAGGGGNVGASNTNYHQRWFGSTPSLLRNQQSRGASDSRDAHRVPLLNGGSPSQSGSYNLSRGGRGDSNQPGRGSSAVSVVSRNSMAEQIRQHLANRAAMTADKSTSTTTSGSSISIGSILGLISGDDGSIANFTGPQSPNTRTSANLVVANQELPSIYSPASGNSSNGGQSPTRSPPISPIHLAMELSLPPTPQPPLSPPPLSPPLSLLFLSPPLSPPSPPLAHRELMRLVPRSATLQFDTLSLIGVPRRRDSRARHQISAPETVLESAMEIMRSEERLLEHEWLRRQGRQLERVDRSTRFEGRKRRQTVRNSRLNAGNLFDASSDESDLNYDLLNTYIFQSRQSPRFSSRQSSRQSSQQTSRLSSRQSSQHLSVFAPHSHVSSPSSSSLSHQRRDYTGDTNSRVARSVVTHRSGRRIRVENRGQRERNVIEDAKEFDFDWPF